MHLAKMARLIPVLALTACGSTPPLLAIEPAPVITVCPRLPNALTQIPLKPAPPTSGSPEALLMHASRYGEWSQTLESRLIAIQHWQAINQE